MKSAFDLANNLHKHSRMSSFLSKATRRLKSQNIIILKFDKDDIKEIKHISHFLYHVDVGKPLLVSMVFNRDDIPRFVSKSFSIVTFSRVYQNIWYDLEIC